MAPVDEEAATGDEVAGPADTAGRQSEDEGMARAAAAAGKKKRGQAAPTAHRKHGKRQKLSSYRGVSRNKGRWVGQIVCDSKLRYLGLFDSEQDAARAYDRAAIRLRGVNAETNFPVSEYAEEVAAVTAAGAAEGGVAAGTAGPAGDAVGAAAAAPLAVDDAIFFRRRTKASKFRGVCLSAGKYVAQITVDKVHHYLGVFLTEREAAEAYDRAALRLRGRHAVVNFPAAAAQELPGAAAASAAPPSSSAPTAGQAPSTAGAYSDSEDTNEEPDPDAQPGDEGRRGKATERQAGLLRALRRPHKPSM